jgi:hypothetical protein
MAEQLIRTGTLTEEMNLATKPDFTLGVAERVMAVYKTYQGVAFFTNKRLVAQDLHGSTKKNECFSLRFSQVQAWVLDNNSDMDLIVDFWLGAGYIRVIVKKAIDPKKLDRLLDEVLLQD